MLNKKIKRGNCWTTPELLSGPPVYLSQLCHKVSVLSPWNTASCTSISFSENWSAENISPTSIYLFDVCSILPPTSLRQSLPLINSPAELLRLNCTRSPTEFPGWVELWVQVDSVTTLLYWVSCHGLLNRSKQTNDNISTPNIHECVCFASMHSPCLGTRFMFAHLGGCICFFTLLGGWWEQHRHSLIRKMYPARLLWSLLSFCLDSLQQPREKGWGRLATESVKCCSAINTGICQMKRPLARQRYYFKCGSRFFKSEKVGGYLTARA